MARDAGTETMKSIQDRASRSGRRRTMSTSAGNMTRRLVEEHALGYEVIAHRHTETATAEAKEIGATPTEVGKTIVLKGERGFVRAVLPASERLDLHKLRGLIGCGSAARLATEKELAAAYPMFELGAVPPFGGPTGDLAVIDHKLAIGETVVIEAGAHDESIRLRTQDLIRIAGAQIADICEDGES
jgi:Ala-tRNA(Pro) deacylase